MTLAEQALYGREFKTVPMPFALYCYNCNGTIHKGEPALRYDAATFTHPTCPNVPLKTFAPHKYGDNR